MTGYEDQWRYATRLRLEASDTSDPVLFRQAAAEFREIDRDTMAELCDRRAAHYEQLDAVA